MSDVNHERQPAIDYRVIPSIEQLRQRPVLRALEAEYGHHALVDALREETDGLRHRLAARAGEVDGRPDASRVAADLEQGVERRLRRLFGGSLRPLINATGVIVHTNLGRAPLSTEALDRLVRIARGYSNLEFDVATGRRGRRDVHVTALLARLTGAAAALVVNNNAAATLLILAALARGREVVISRGELVEIGGGFRVPEVMAQSGAVLREVGTTNRTRIGDYEAAIGAETALILRVHRSNFRMEGFTEQPALADLVTLGRRCGVPVVEDLGSGWLGADTLRQSDGTIGDTDGETGILAEEPTVGDSVAAGVDLICFSGDKLLGGPQAGLIVGQEVLVERLSRHPLMRALRVDKLTYAALEGTLVDYLRGRAARGIPVARMLSASPGTLETRARAVKAAVGPARRFEIDVLDGLSMVGGGSAPGIPLPTRLLSLRPRGCGATALESALRDREPAVIARVEEERVLLDLRTVQPEEDQALVEALRAVGNAGT